jgi:two-component system sensor histidine kinase DesK
MWAAIWLIYLVQPFQVALHRPHVWQRVAGATAILAFAGIYLGSFVYLRVRRRQDRGPAFAWLSLVALTTLAAVLIAITGQDSLGVLIYTAVMAIFLLPTRVAWLVVAVLALATTALPRLVAGWQTADDLTFSLLVASIAVWGVMGLVERNAELAAAREEIARLAVAAERHRFARDLHDLLGHSLTVISVKAELAGRLVRLAPDRAEAELAEVQQLAREALVDVRGSVGGYRAMSLDGELASARTALDAAGIEADLPTRVDALPPDRAELFAWAVREGVTNVVRHSEAKNCRIRVGANSVEIVDDGRGPHHRGPHDRGPDGWPETGHHGLLGLRERVAAAGGQLTVGRAPGGGFALGVALPAVGAT